MVAFIDEGPGSPGAQFWMEDETYLDPPDPIVDEGAWTQFGAWQREGYDNYRIYWWDYDTRLSGWVDTGVARTAGEHALLLGMRADGTVDYWLDGYLVHSTTDVTPNYFGDIYLAGHSDLAYPGEIITFTYYETGTDYSHEVARMYFGDVSLSGGFQTGHFCPLWDLTAGDLLISFTYDANGLVDDFGDDAHAWAELGLRTIGYGDFNPTLDVEGAGVWLATDYHWTANTFDPDPPGSPTLDLDDKLILQKAGGHGEGDYNLPSTPPSPGANHRVWFDRDGVDQWQAQNPLAVDGGTYNTGGVYEIDVLLHATSDTGGEAYLAVNSLDQGFETDGNWNTMELSPAGMTFTGDMKRLQVFYGLYGYGATHTVSLRDIVVSGPLNPLQLQFVKSESDSIVEVGQDATLKVRVTDSYGVGVLNFPVVFSSDPAGLAFTDVVNPTDPDGYATVTAAIATAGVYRVTATVCGKISDTWTLVVYDPSGMAAGGGWYYPLDDQDVPMDGTAKFGFVAKYIKGVSRGNLEFQYQAGDINLKSTEITWLVVSGSNAQFKGIATMNGELGYYFRVIAKDNGEPGAGTDWFGIKIWSGDPDTDAPLVHSSHNTLSGGNIMVRTKS